MSEQVVNELALLKERADTLGIKYSPNISVETLKAKINEKLNPEPVKETAMASAFNRAAVRAKALKLVRCRIVNLHPDKKAVPGEIITVANKTIGKITKYIPFGDESANGYHIPYCIYEYLKNKKYAQRIKEKGAIAPRTKLVPEYSIEVLPQLTPEELKKLAQSQQARASIATDDESVI